MVRLYEFDRTLRTLIHDGMERVEVALRSQMSYRLGSLGPLAYRDAVFQSTFDHTKRLATARIRMDRAHRRSEPIRYHEAKYNGELPIRVRTEMLDLVDVSKLHHGLFAKDQWPIAERLGVSIYDSGLSANQRKKAARYIHLRGGSNRSPCCGTHILTTRVSGIVPSHRSARRDSAPLSTYAPHLAGQSERL